jgi:glutamate-5-semialdehyde dehydrogenase
MPQVEPLEMLTPGAQVLLGGDRLLRVPDAIAARYRKGDALMVVEATEEVLLLPQQERAIARAAVDRALAAFEQLNRIDDARISAFFEGFAARLEDAQVWEQVQRANQADLAAASARGRSTTRLGATESLRRGMIDGLRGWLALDSRRGQVLETVEHDGWKAELVGAALGVVAFVFEGRPNVLADASGVLRSGNAVVFRIGSDALGTARALMEHALTPALSAAGLPEAAVVLIDSAEHAAGWALFSDPRLALAVARGSGPAVATLGALARQAGVPVSLHGTGGAWLVASERADADSFAQAVFESLDRKVCNTLNVCCIPRARAAELGAAFIGALERAGARLGHGYKLHVVHDSGAALPEALFSRRVQVARAAGAVSEPQAEWIDASELGREWEWEQTPELTLQLVDDLEQAVTLFNAHSPQFVACLISPDAAEQQRFYDAVNAPFVGDGHTRWVDGQRALRRPELGLSNWQWGRLFGRGGILSGDSVYTVRTRVRQR